MPASRRLIPLTLAVIAVAGLGVWFGVHREQKTGIARPTAGDVEVNSTTAKDRVGLPTPGSAVEFDSLLALARGDLAAFTEWLAQHVAALTPDKRTAFLRELLRRWQTEWQANAPGGIRDAFHRLADTAPEVAGKLVAMLPSLPLRHLLVEDLIAAWGAREPLAAERWIDALDNANDRSHGLTSLASARLRTDAAAAMQWANARLENPTNPAIVQDFTLGFAEVDPVRTAQWATALPEGALKTQATVTLATAWADKDAPKAGQWAATLPQSAARDDAVTVVGQVWTGTAPEEAVRWFGAQTFTSEDARFLAFHDFSQALTDADPDASQRWIDSLKEPATADAALAGAADATYDDNPERALLTAMKIKDTVTRATTVGELMKTWREEDADAAEKFATVHMPTVTKKPSP